MILVFGGTTEGKKILQILENLRIRYLYSTKTEVKLPALYYGQARFGALNNEALNQLIQVHNIQLIIHAAHPFASQLHATIASVTIPVLRVERNFAEKRQHPLIHYVSTYPAAERVLKKLEAPQLLLSGVQSIPKLKNLWMEKQVFFRILNRPESLAIARKAGFPEGQLILGIPNFTTQMEYQQLIDKQIAAVLTKESGDSGAQELKMEAALKANIPIVILTRPALPDHFHLLSANSNLLENLQKQMIQILGQWD